MSAPLGPVIAVTDPSRYPWREMLRTLEIATRHGFGAVQLRAPEADGEERRRRLHDLRAHCAPGTRLSVNGDAELALAERCGLHLPERASQPEAIARPFGRSVHSLEAARRAVEERCDYAIWGTLFATSSKPGRPGAGIAALEAICGELELPLYAIGGISLENLDRVRRAGACGVAICSALFEADDPARSAERFAAG